AHAGQEQTLDPVEVDPVGMPGKFIHGPPACGARPRSPEGRSFGVTESPRGPTGVAQPAPPRSARRAMTRQQTRAVEEICELPLHALEVAVCEPQHDEPNDECGHDAEEVR